MFCRYCGHQIEDGAVFCRYCGKPQKMEEPDGDPVNRRTADPESKGAVGNQPSVNQSPDHTVNHSAAGQPVQKTENQVQPQPVKPKFPAKVVAITACGAAAAVGVGIFASSAIRKNSDNGENDSVVRADTEESGSESGSAESGGYGTDDGENDGSGDMAGISASGDDAGETGFGAGDDVIYDYAADGDATIEEQVLYDENGIRITATDLFQDPEKGTGLHLSVENDTDRIVRLWVKDLTVNNCTVFYISDYWAHPGLDDVAPHETAVREIFLPVTKMQNAGILNVGRIQLTFDVKNTDGDLEESLITENATFDIHTSQYDHMDTSMRDDGVLMSDENGVRVSARCLSDSPVWGSGGVILITNNTDEVAVPFQLSFGTWSNGSPWGPVGPHRNAIFFVECDADFLRRDDALLDLRLLLMDQNMEETFADFDTNLSPMQDSDPVETGNDGVLLAADGDEPEAPGSGAVSATDMTFDSWQSAYTAVLGGEGQSYWDGGTVDHYCFNILDINGDQIPELCVSSDYYFGGYEFYTFRDGRVIDLGSYCSIFNGGPRVLVPEGIIEDYAASEESRGDNTYRVREYRYYKMDPSAEDGVRFVYGERFLMNKESTRDIIYEELDEGGNATEMTQEESNAKRTAALGVDQQDYDAYCFATPEGSPSPMPAREINMKPVTPENIAEILR